MGMAVSIVGVARWLLVGLLGGGLWLAAGCDDPGPVVGDGGADAGRDAALDGGADGGDMAPPDGALDALTDGMADARVDAAAADAALDPALAPCSVEPSPRPVDALRVAGCRLVRGGEAAVLPRAVVVSGDSLDRAASTPLHEPPMYADLARAGVEVVWLLVLWHGIEPTPGTYNGAYLGRVCQSARQAGAAGLGVVLAMTQQRFGPSLGGHGVPSWATPEGLAPVPVHAGPEHPSLRAVWQGFWSGDAPDGLAAAWVRLLDTCALEADHGIVGVAPLAAPQGPAEAMPRFAALSDEVEAAAEARLGPLLRFESPLWVDGALRWLDRPGPDRVRALPGWGPGRWPGAAPAEVGWRSAARLDAIRASRPLWLVGAGGETPAAMAAAQAEVEAEGLVGVVWQDGFGGPYGLRDADGRPAALWGPALDRPRPARVAGRPLGWRSDADAVTLRWLADGSEQGLSRFDMAGRAPGEARLTPADGIEWFTDFDPATGLLAIFVEGAPGVVELRVPIVRP